MTTYTEGICGDGVVILRDGVMMTISEVLAALNAPAPPVVDPPEEVAPTRFKGSDHIVPLADCPMCGAATDFVDVGGFWCAECSACGLALCDYSSRLDLCNDWNRRVPPPPVVEVSDEVAQRIYEHWEAGAPDIRGQCQSARAMIAAVQSILGPTLGLVEREEMARAVEAAYREGLRDGNQLEWHGGDKYVPGNWKNSESLKRLEGGR